MLSNFFLTAKKSDESVAEAKRQACYDGALGARGIHALQSYGRDKPVYDNNAYTITSTYHDGTLKLYTIHPLKPTRPGSRPEYVMTQLKAFALTSDPETFRQGATAFRNGRDLAKEWRDGFIEAANKRVRGISIESQSSISTAVSALVESDTSANKTEYENTHQK